MLYWRRRRATRWMLLWPSWTSTNSTSLIIIGIERRLPSFYKPISAYQWIFSIIWRLRYQSKESWLFVPKMWPATLLTTPRYVGTRNLTSMQEYEILEPLDSTDKKHWLDLLQAQEEGKERKSTGTIWLLERRGVEYPRTSWTRPRRKTIGIECEGFDEKNSPIRSCRSAVHLWENDTRLSTLRHSSLLVRHPTRRWFFLHWLSQWQGWLTGLTPSTRPLHSRSIGNDEEIMVSRSIVAELRYRIADMKVGSLYLRGPARQVRVPC